MQVTLVVQISSGAFKGRDFLMRLTDFGRVVAFRELVI